MKPISNFLIPLRELQVPKSNQIVDLRDYSGGVFLQTNENNYPNNNTQPAFLYQDSLDQQGNQNLLFGQDSQHPQGIIAQQNNKISQPISNNTQLQQQFSLGQPPSTASFHQTGMDSQSNQQLFQPNSQVPIQNDPRIQLNNNNNALTTQKQPNQSNFVQFNQQDTNNQHQNGRNGQQNEKNNNNSQNLHTNWQPQQHQQQSILGQQIQGMQRNNNNNDLIQNSNRGNNKNSANSLGIFNQNPQGQQQQQYQQYSSYLPGNHIGISPEPNPSKSFQQNRTLAQPQLRDSAFSPPNIASQQLYSQNQQQQYFNEDLINELQQSQTDPDQIPNLFVYFEWFGFSKESIIADKITLQVLNEKSSREFDMEVFRQLKEQLNFAEAYTVESFCDVYSRAIEILQEKEWKEEMFLEAARLKLQELISLQRLAQNKEANTPINQQQPSVLYIEINNIKGLPYPSRYCVHIEQGDKELSCTQVSQITQEPTFKQQFILRLADIRGAINLDVEDVNNNMRIGKVSIKLQQFLHQRKIEEWYILEERGGALGSVDRQMNISIQYIHSEKLLYEAILQENDFFQPVINEYESRVSSSREMLRILNDPLNRPLTSLNTNLLHSQNIQQKGDIPTQGAGGVNIAQITLLILAICLIAISLITSFYQNSQNVTISLLVFTMIILAKQGHSVHLPIFLASILIDFGWAAYFILKSGEKNILIEWMHHSDIIIQLSLCAASVVIKILLVLVLSWVHKDDHIAQVKIQEYPSNC